MSNKSGHQEKIVTKMVTMILKRILGRAEKVIKYEKRG